MSQMDRQAKIAESRRLDRAIARKERLRRERRSANPDASGRGTTDKSAVLGDPHRAPRIRTGENLMGSRGYEYHRVACLLQKSLRPEDCKIELEVHDKLLHGMQRSSTWKPAVQNSIVAPLDPGYLMGTHSPYVDADYGRTLRSMIWAGGENGADPDQAEWLSKKSGIPLTATTWQPDTQKVGAGTQSWVQQNLGGSLVPYPEMGPLIPLLRNKNALMTAGATVMPMPPQGSISFPRQTTPSLGYHVGEGGAGTQTTVGTDQLTLRAKKIMALIVTNLELIKFGGPVVEQMFRNDMTTTLGLTLDYDMLQAEGSDNVTAGLIGYPGVQSFNGTGSVGDSNGYALAPQDLYTFISMVQAANAQFEGYILRPELFWVMAGLRAGVYNGTGISQVGQFVFDVTRKMSENDFDRIAGYKAVCTANVPLNRTRGTSSNLTTVYGGWWSDYKIALYGTLEFAVSEEGASWFTNYQQAIRAVLQADGGPQHPGAFVYSDALYSSKAGA